MSESIDTQVEELAAFLRPAQDAVAFTGMGISAASVPSGFFETMKAKGWAPIMVNDFVKSEEQRREAWRLHFFSAEQWTHAQPNKGHLAVAKLVSSGKVRCVITQNVDNFHQQSGVPDERVIELHGNSTYAACLDCGKRQELAEVRAVFESNEALLICSACGGIIKTAVVSFGQPMPETPLQLAKQMALACDLFLVFGSSLVVQPSSAIPKVAKDNGAALVIVNHEPTEIDDVADMVIHAAVDETLHAAVARL